MTYNLKVSSQLLSCYFHQDWPEEFGSETLAIEAMINSEPRETLNEALKEVHELLLTPVSEADLREVMTHDAGCYLDPSYKKLSYRQWLEKILIQLEK